MGTATGPPQRAIRDQEGNMGLRFKNQQSGECFFVTTSFKDHQPFANIQGVYEALAESLIFYSRMYNATIAGYVLMPSHLHLLLFIEGDLLGHFMRDFKKFIAQKAVSDLGFKPSTLWTPRYDRVVISSEEVLRTKLSYIHNNPVKAALVHRTQDWRWSSAADYVEDRQGPVTVWKGWA
jgi:putative transposase